MLLHLLKKVFKGHDHSPDLRKLFPLSQISPHRKNKLVFLNRDFKQLVKSELAPQLKAVGFSSSEYTFFRELSTHFEIIFLGKTKYGGALSIDAAIKFKPPLSMGLPDFKTLWPFQDCESFIRLSPDKQDNWWVFRDTYEENARIINEMFVLIQKMGFPYFKRFDNLHSILESIKFEDGLTEKFYEKYKFGITDARIYFSLMQYYRSIKKLDAAKAFAKKGLAVKYLEDQYKHEFEQFLQSNL
jgi:hypothetical protein